MLGFIYLRVQIVSWNGTADRDDDGGSRYRSAGQSVEGWNLATQELNELGWPIQGPDH